MSRPAVDALAAPVSASWFDRLITLRSAAFRHGACNPLGPDYAIARRAADDAFDTAVADVREAMAVLARETWMRSIDTPGDPSWQCPVCHWIGVFGEAAFGPSDDPTAYCPECLTPTKLEAI